VRIEEVDRLREFEMWVWRRVEKVSRLDRKSGEDILDCIGETRCLMESIMKQRNWIDLVVRGC